MIRNSEEETAARFFEILCSFLLSFAVFERADRIFVKFSASFLTFSAMVMPCQREKKRGVPVLFTSFCSMCNEILSHFLQEVRGLRRNNSSQH